MTLFGSKNHILCVDSSFTCNTIKPPCSSQLLSLGGRVIWNIINCCDHPQYHWHKGWISNTKRKALNCQCIKSDKSYKCLMAALQCLTTAWRLPDDCLKTVLQMLYYSELFILTIKDSDLVHRIPVHYDTTYHYFFIQGN